jgi:hypothetical protein
MLRTPGGSGNEGIFSESASDPGRLSMKIAEPHIEAFQVSRLRSKDCVTASGSM